MIKHILVPTDASKEALIGVRYAVALAKTYGATLVGLHVVDVRLLEGPFLRDIAASLGTAPYVNYQGNVAMILRERGEAALKTFRDCCAEANVECETTLATGVVARSIVEQCNLVDMVVMGRAGEHKEWLDGLVGSTTAAVVRRAPRPVLVTGMNTPGRNRFLVSYDGSPHAKRALHAAADFATLGSVPLTVLLVGDEEMELVTQEARAFLDAYKLAVDYVRREGDPSEVIVGYAGECKADLLVMGAYGHTKVRELVVGSTTAYALNHAPCPVLLTR